MLHSHQDRTLQDLARSIARSVDDLGAECTAQLLARLALGLMDRSDDEQPIESPDSASKTNPEASYPPPTRTGAYGTAAPNGDFHRPRHRTRP